MNVPATLKYTKDHEWAQVSGKEVTIGITDHAQNSLGDIVFVELPEIGRTLKEGETFGVVESVKAVSDLYSPVSGKVVAVNSPLVSEPHHVNSSPYDKGWLIKVEMSGASSQLMDAKAYQSLLESL